MKYIKKGAAPRELTAWFNSQPIESGKRLNCRYEQLSVEAKDAVEKRLLAEQGWLCCYTGMALTKDNFHIEHLIPRAVSKRQDTHEDVDYQNMMAAYPKGACPYGAQIRGDKPLPIHPLQPGCEQKFHFNLQGKIAGIDDDARATIKCLKLDHELLDEMRRAAVEEALFPDNHSLSEAKAQVVATQYCSLNHSGKYPRFCFVVAQAAQEYLHKVERERKRRQAIQNQAKR